MIRLALDTSFDHLSICITKNESTVANYFSSSSRKNSKIIFGVIEKLLNKARIKLSEIDIYIVNCGPGSYTGVRIGMSIIKTFALVFKKPILPVNSLELIAGQIRNKKINFNVLLNCTRKEVFHANFKIDENLPILNSPIYLSNLENFLENSDQMPVVFYRINNEKRPHDPLFDKLKKLKLDFPIPDAILLDSIGAKKFKNISFDSNFNVKPLYIKRDI